MALPSSKSATTTHKDPVVAAAASLQLLLREDPLLVEHHVIESSCDTFTYTATLLDESEASSPNSTTVKAEQCLQDVERKLALVESLAEKLSRTRPEAVASQLLHLHGYKIDDVEQEVVVDGSSKEPMGSSESMNAAPTTTTTLAVLRDRADRLQRQSLVLDGMAHRVEGTLVRAQARMQLACLKLERVLQLSSTLKMILKWQFEQSKGAYDLEDLRDLTRAAASLSVIQTMWKTPDFQTVPRIAVVEELRGPAEKLSRDVRAAAALLLTYHSQPTHRTGSTLQEMGAMLQVYYHLGELPHAVWKIVGGAHAFAEAACRNLWKTSTLTSTAELAKRTDRTAQRKALQLRLEAAEAWGASVYEAANHVRGLQKVLLHKSDPIKRMSYIDVIASAESVPAAYFTDAVPLTVYVAFWTRFCKSLASIVEETRQKEPCADIGAFYPVLRKTMRQVVADLQDSTAMQSDAVNTMVPGILGGSASLMNQMTGLNGSEPNAENPQGGTAHATWTQKNTRVLNGANGAAPASSPGLFIAGGKTDAMKPLFRSLEWKSLQDGLNGVQEAFVDACEERLCAPLQYMFPDHVAMDEEGMSVPSGLSLLPSKYDVQRFDENIRRELAFADPRDGGGDPAIVSLTADCVVRMIQKFCMRAKNAISGVEEGGLVRSDLSMTESLQHDRKVAAIMFTMATYLKSAPEKVFEESHRHALHDKTETLCGLCIEALRPALSHIDEMVKSLILKPLHQALGNHIVSEIATMHKGVYWGSSANGSESFVQNKLSPTFETIAKLLLKFPPPYAAYVTSKIASLSISIFLTNCCLMRPLDESSKLQVTQDLADLELALEQLTVKAGADLHLSDVENGLPYSEMRAARQMLFWNGVDDTMKSPHELARLLLREPWSRHLRRSTLLHFLFSMGPDLLSSPHHYKRMKVHEYAESIVRVENVESAEDNAWMVAMACCESFEQRSSSIQGKSSTSGDARIPYVILQVGHELAMRRHA